MADPKKELEINLKATGGDAAAEEIKKPLAAIEGMVPAWETAGAAATSAAEATTEAAAEIEKGIDPAEEWLDRVGESTDKAADSTDEYTGQLSKLLKELAKVPGPLGDAAASLAQVVAGAGRLGPQAAIIAAAGAVGIGLSKAIIDKLDEINAAANRALPNLADTSQRAQIEASALAEAQDQAAEAAKRGQKAYDDYAKSLRRIADEQAALADAELGAELAQIDLDALNGKLSEAEALQARYDARRTAEARKRQAELAAIEQEVANQAMENERLRAAWIAAQLPAERAQSDLNVASRGASGQPELADQVAARNAAAEALAQNTSTDPEAIASLEKVLEESQNALLEAYDKLIAEKIKARDEAVARSAAAGSALQAGTANATRLAAEQAALTTGPGAQINAARDREAALRLESAQRKIQMDQEAANQKAQQEEAARQSRAQADAEARAISADLARMAGNATGAGGVAKEDVARLNSAAESLRGGADASSTSAALNKVADVLENLKDKQSEELNRAFRRIELLESQSKAGRS